MLYINPAYQDIYSRPVEDLYESPQSFVDAAHRKNQERYEADIEELIDDIKPGDPEDAYEGEYRIRRPDGEIRWVAVLRFPIENEQGVVDRIVGRVQDITERKRRKREFEQIINSVNDSIVIHDLGTAELIEENDTLCDLLGYDRDEVLERGRLG